MRLRRAVTHTMNAEQNTTDPTSAATPEGPVQRLAQTEEAIALIRRNKPGDLKRAVEILEQAGPEGIGRLLKEVSAEAEKRRPRQTWNWAARAFAIVLVGYVGLLALLQFLPVQVSGGAAAGVMNVMFVVVLGSMAASQFQVGTAEALAHLYDPRAVGPLAEVLDSVAGRRRRLVLAALERLLPKLTSADGHLLDDHQRLRIARAIAKRDSPSFSLAGLAALDRIGDHTCTVAVRNIALGRTAISRDETVRLAAVDAMPRFERRAAAARHLARLVRPADAPNSDMLLRPAPQAAEPEVGLLVRPAGEPPSARAGTDPAGEDEGFRQPQRPA
jgi:hypothetical protein